MHNARCGGTTRHRLKKFTEYCIEALSKGRNVFYYSWLKMTCYIKILLFEYAFFLYNFIFGFYEAKYGEDKKLVETSLD